jgi:hypothetical protein
MFAVTNFRSSKRLGMAGASSSAAGPLADGQAKMAPKTKSYSHLRSPREVDIASALRKHEDGDDFAGEVQFRKPLFLDAPLCSLYGAAHDWPGPESTNLG